MLFFFSSRRRHTRFDCDWSSDVCSSDLDVFRKVLTLDPENVLGLKMLADIAERGKRYDEAVEWLSRLLSADPMNGDAAEALARAKGKAALAGQAVQAVATQPTAPVRAVSAAPPAPPAA